MIVFPNCKINLGLSVLEKRQDGFHNLETVFYPVSFTDILEIVPANADVQDDVSFSASGLPIAGNPGDNLCIQAYQLLKTDFPILPSVNMHLHKLIPIGAGLGGGSADGAFTLGLLNTLFDLQLTPAQLIQYAAKLGSDCPFFMVNKACAATGRGEILEEIELKLDDYVFVLVNPHIHINTGWAFSRLDLHNSSHRALSLQEAIHLPIETWKDVLINDFEKPVFEHYPVIKSIKDHLYDQGALYASMSGSGSTVFGIFDRKLTPSFNLFSTYSVHHIK